MKTKSISHLLADHDAVRGVLGALRHFLRDIEGRCDGTGAPQDMFDPHELWEVLDYLSEHLLMCHEEKEEVALLPELSRHGLSWQDTSLQHVRQEHRHIRYLMRSVRNLVHQSRAWSREDCRHFLGISRELHDFLLHHMDAEEKHLFIRLDAALSAEDDARLATEFEGIHSDFAGMPDAQKLQKSGAAFLARYVGSE